MSIIGQNSLLNQYVPTIYIKDLLDGQILKYDSTRKAFVNSTGISGITSIPGNVRAVSNAAVNLTTGTTNVGVQLPAGSTVLSVKIQITEVDSGTGTISVGKVGNVSAYMTTSENNAQILGLYIAETYVTESNSVQIIATCTGAISGMASILVVYKIAE